MFNPEFFGIFDVPALVLTAFVVFFFSLILYLRREDRREGYPLEDDATGRLEPASGLFFTARPKTFLLPHGGVLHKPNAERETPVFSASRRTNISGAPLSPVGDGMLAKVGPGAYAQRAQVPDEMFHGGPKIVPLRVAPGFSIDGGLASDPRGMTVLGADRAAAGLVSDIWVDKAEYLIRYLEVDLAAVPGKRVLLPMPMVVVDKSRREVKVDAILASQFINVPTLSYPDQVTLDEEERVTAYYGGGYLYATPERLEPLL
jgi:photosynthetic reaction center H subunit